MENQGTNSREIQNKKKNKEIKITIYDDNKLKK